MKQILLSCFLLLRLDQYHKSTFMDTETLGWVSHSVEFQLPVSCQTFDQINIGDDFLQSMYLRKLVKGNPKSWNMIVVRKIVQEDQKEEFDCF